MVNIAVKGTKIGLIGIITTHIGIGSVPVHMIDLPSNKQRGMAVIIRDLIGVLGQTVGTDHSLGTDISPLADLIAIKMIEGTGQMPMIITEAGLDHLHVIGAIEVEISLLPAGIAEKGISHLLVAVIETDTNPPVGSKVIEICLQGSSNVMTGTGFLGGQLHTERSMCVRECVLMLIAPIAAIDMQSTL